MAAVVGLWLVGASGASPTPALSTPAWPTCVPRTQPIRIRINELSAVRHGRLVTLTLRSTAMRGRQHVNVLLPRGYRASARRRYHVLYLLHGAGGDYRTWMGIGAEQLLGTLPVIAVMPSASQPAMDGDYTDWAFTTPAGPPPPAWETYHIRELVPFIDRHFRTIPAAAGRAVAGISMGGGGATKYAAEYPGTFGYVGTFSGESHPLLPIALSFQPKNCRWGNPATHQVIWRDNDSAELAGNLRGVRIFIRSGTGVPGPFDSSAPPTDPGQAALRRVRLAVEYGAHLENEALVAGLRRARVRDVNVAFFPGSHTLPYWIRDTRQFVSWLRTQFRSPPGPPARDTIQSAHTYFTAWGWAFTVHRPVREFLYLRLSRTYLHATGSGRIDVRTPSWFRAGSIHVIRSGTHRRAVRADRRGALMFTLDLGPAHRRDQTRFGPSATRGWRSIGVWISSTSRGVRALVRLSPRRTGLWRVRRRGRRGGW